MTIMDRHDGMNKCRFEMWLTDRDLKKLKKYKEKCKKKKSGITILPRTRPLN